MPCACADQLCMVFDDDPENFWPYDADGLCPRCHKPPAGREDVRVSVDHPELAEIFRGLPFPSDPCHRKLRRIELMMAFLVNGDVDELERIVRSMYRQAEVPLGG